jgi:hypothetical protein
MKCNLWATKNHDYGNGPGEAKEKRYWALESQKSSENRRKSPGRFYNGYSYVVESVNIEPTMIDWSEEVVLCSASTARVLDEMLGDRAQCSLHYQDDNLVVCLVKTKKPRLVYILPDGEIVDVNKNIANEYLRACNNSEFGTHGDEVVTYDPDSFWLLKKITQKKTMNNQTGEQSPGKRGRKMKAYQVVGWTKQLPRSCVGKAAYLSDGAIFSTPEKAENYGEKNMQNFETKEIDANPEVIDYLEKLSSLRGSNPPERERE